VCLLCLRAFELHWGAPHSCLGVENFKQIIQVRGAPCSCAMFLLVFSNILMGCMRKSYCWIVSLGRMIGPPLLLPSLPRCLLVQHPPPPVVLSPSPPGANAFFTSHATVCSFT
jgi:hypothetical protein